jgi:hypothetical protein
MMSVSLNGTVDSMDRRSVPLTMEKKIWGDSLVTWSIGLLDSLVDSTEF